MGSIEEDKQELIRAIRESGECRRFEACRERMECFPEKKDRLNAFRRRMYRYQTAPPSQDGFGEMEALFGEQEAVRQDQDIADYLDAELALCRLLQRICTDILNVTDMQIEGLEDG